MIQEEGGNPSETQEEIPTQVDGSKETGGAKSVSKKDIVAKSTSEGSKETKGWKSEAGGPTDTSAADRKSGEGELKDLEPPQENVTDHEDNESDEEVEDDSASIESDDSGHDDAEESDEDSGNDEEGAEDEDSEDSSSCELPHT